MDCIFCKIINKKAPAEVLHETQDAVMIRDIHPSAPIHYMVVSRRHLVSIADMHNSDEMLLGHMIRVAKEGADKLGLSGYKLMFNVGRDGGQIIDHIHLHLLGGWTKNEK